SAKDRSRAPRPGHLGAFGSGEPGDSGESGEPDEPAAEGSAAGAGAAERMMAAMPDSNGPRGLTNICQIRGTRTKVSAWMANSNDCSDAVPVPSHGCATIIGRVLSRKTTCAEYTLNGIDPGADSGASIHDLRPSSTAAAWQAAIVISAVPPVESRSNGVPECGPAIASHHQDVAGVTPWLPVNRAAVRSVPKYSETSTSSAPPPARLSSSQDTPRPRTKSPTPAVKTARRCLLMSSLATAMPSRIYDSHCSTG